MLFLLDSNIAIKSDPLSYQLEADVDLAMRFHRLAASGHHDLRVHPSSRLDFERHPVDALRRARLTIFERYEPIHNPPEVSDSQRAALGTPAPGSNDAVDDDLLAAVVGDAVEYLVTEDVRLQAKARRLGVAERVLRLPDVVSLLEALHAPPPQPPPAVQRVKVHELDRSDPIFDSLRADYRPDFDEWLTRAARAQRDALLIHGTGGHAAICILKPEPAGEHGVPGPLLKLSTFKVGEEYSGQKYGELLLKAVFNQALSGSVTGLFVTVFERHTQLVGLLEDFGFETLPARNRLGELVMVKSLRPSEDHAPVSPLEHHIRYGPPALSLDGNECFVVPIEPRWHRVLFPDAEPDDQALFPAPQALGRHPFGNALRKAYLCNSPSRLLAPGHVLLFYRSQDERAVFVVGICEDTLISREPSEIAAMVGRRTVYTYQEMGALARRGDVLVVLFRQDRVLRDDPITLEDLRNEGILTTWPQSVTQVRPKGRQWLRRRLAG